MEFDQVYSMARGGDESARKQLVIQCEEALARYVERTAGKDVRRWYSVDDICQAVWAIFFRRLVTYPEGLSLEGVRGYLCKLAYWFICDAAQRGIRSSGDSELGGVEPATPTATGPVTRRDELERLRGMIRRMPGDFSDVIRLRFLEERPPKEIAQELQLTVSAVNKKLVRARHWLRERLAEAQ